MHPRSLLRWNETS
jgi:hypothetical protein